MAKVNNLIISDINKSKKSIILALKYESSVTINVEVNVQIIHHTVDYFGI